MNEAKQIAKTDLEKEMSKRPINRAPLFGIWKTCDTVSTRYFPFPSIHAISKVGNAVGERLS